MKKGNTKQLSYLNKFAKRAKQKRRLPTIWEKLRSGDSMYKYY